MVHTVHRLLNQHEWEDISETTIPPQNIDGLQYKGFGDLEGLIRELREGYVLVRQQCKICGDHKTIRI